MLQGIHRFCTMFPTLAGVFSLRDQCTQQRVRERQEFLTTRVAGAQGELRN